MATVKTKTGVQITKGGRKGHEWTRTLILATALAVTEPKAARKSSRMSSGAPSPIHKPVGASSTVIPNPSNPPAAIIADDVSVQAGGAPRNNPTVAAGEATAPTASQVIADSGPMAAGTYYLEITMAFDGAAAAGKALKASHRDSTNTTILTALGRCPCGGAMGIGAERIVLAANERVRVINDSVAGAAGEVAQAQIRLYKLGA